MFYLILSNYSVDCLGLTGSSIRFIGGLKVFWETIHGRRWWWEEHTSAWYKGV
jgi:hypothetical protein